MDQDGGARCGVLGGFRVRCCVWSRGGTAPFLIRSASRSMPVAQPLAQGQCYEISPPVDGRCECILFCAARMRFFWLVADGIPHEHAVCSRVFSVPHEDGYTCDFQFLVSCVCIIPTLMFYFHFLTRFATDRSLLQYICSMIRVTLSLIRATLFQFFTFCLLIHLNTDRENTGKKERWQYLDWMWISSSMDLSSRAEIGTVTKFRKIHRELANIWTSGNFFNSSVTSN